MSVQLLTSLGYRVLDDFRITSIPDTGGILLACTAGHEGTVDQATWEWPAHVDAPTLMRLAVVASGHVAKYHSESEGGP